MARPKNSVNDNHYPEVDQINSFAIFMGYLLMGVRGLGLLMLTWTTVVLLGGFVSVLQKKDFWCLTAITLVQTAGVFDFLLKEKASDVGNSWAGLLAAVFASVLRPSFKKDTNISVNSSKIQQEDKGSSVARSLVALVLIVVQLPMFAIVLCPLAILYVLGMYLSAGISLWRLIQHDYGNSDDVGANLKPALNVLYTLAVAQGVVHGYRTIYDLVARNGPAEEVAKYYSLEADLVTEYLDETVAGCMKDPSFARGRNLVTYAVDLLLESKSRYGYISGVLILGKVHEWNGLIRKVRSDWDYDLVISEQQGQLKQLLVGSASFGHVVERLFEIFGPRSPYSTEIRTRAARIVATVADRIRLNQFPAQGMMVIQYISSLLDTSAEEYNWRPVGYERRIRPLLSKMDEWLPPKGYDRDWLLDYEDLFYTRLDEIPSTEVTQDNKTQAYKGLVVQGLHILQGLAVDEDNCRVISNNQDMISKAIAPLLVSDHPHSADHHDDNWSSVAKGSLLLLKRLMATPSPPEETETKLRNYISDHSQAIFSTLKFILECPKCQVLLKRQALEVLLDLSLSMDTYTAASIMPGGSGSSSSKMLIWILLHISLLPDYHFDRMCGSIHLAKKSSDITRLAGEKLETMLSSSSQMSCTLRSVGDIVRSLTTVVADAENDTYIGIHEATILKHLVVYYTKDDENLKQIKKAMTM